MPGREVFMMTSMTRYTRFARSHPRTAATDRSVTGWYEKLASVFRQVFRHVFREGGEAVAFVVVVKIGPQSQSQARSVRLRFPELCERALEEPLSWDIWGPRDICRARRLPSHFVQS